MPTYTTVPGGNFTSQWETVIPGGSNHFSVINEGIPNIDATDFIQETRLNINDRFRTVDAVPALLKEATGMQVFLYVDGEAGCRDTHIIMHDDTSGVTMATKNAARTDTGGIKKILGWDLVPGPTHGDTYTRAEIKTMMLRFRTVAAGTADPPNEQE